MRILLIDNYDSFVYNLAQALGSFGAEPVVVRNDAPIGELRSLQPDGIVISPGPGTPEDAGVSIDAVRAFAPDFPVLGVCLGHQAVGVAFGATVARAAVGPVHGKSSVIEHEGEGVFYELPSPLDAIRYHSLAVDEATMPEELRVTARAEDGTIMGLRHSVLQVEGVQFHPESVLTELGPRLLANYLNRVA